MRPDVYISRLEQERAKASHTALAQPGDTLFAYGRAVGFYAGLAHAKAVYEELLGDDERYHNRS